MTQITGADLQGLLVALGDVGAEDVEWSEGITPPDDAEDFALEAIFVICNSGMKNTVARGIYERVKTHLLAGRSAREGFGHPGKTAAIDLIWRAREAYFFGYLVQPSDRMRLEYLAALPWIGDITKYHLAKNFGVNVAKPDVHLHRLADRAGEDVQAMCARLAAETGYRTATVDLILWRACANGVLDSRTGRI